MSGTSPRANPSGMRINGSNFLIIVSRFLLCGSRGAAELQNWCSIATHTSRPSGASFQRRQLALLELGSRFMHRPKEFRPILKVSRENLLDLDRNAHLKAERRLFSAASTCPLGTRLPFHASPEGVPANPQSQSRKSSPPTFESAAARSGST